MRRSVPSETGDSPIGSRRSSVSKKVSAGMQQQLLRIRARDGEEGMRAERDGGRIRGAVHDRVLRGDAVGPERVAHARLQQVGVADLRHHVRAQQHARVALLRDLVGGVAQQPVDRVVQLRFGDRQRPGLVAVDPDPVADPVRPGHEDDARAGRGGTVVGVGRHDGGAADDEVAQRGADLRDLRVDALRVEVDLDAGRSGHAAIVGPAGVVAPVGVGDLPGRRGLPGGSARMGASASGDRDLRDPRRARCCDCV